MKTLLWTLFVVGSLLAGAQAQGHRRPRHMLDRPTSTDRLDVIKYPLCSVGGVQAACLADVECQKQRGRFAGYCNNFDQVCCVVETTCGATTSAHSVLFNNPSYPRKDEEAVLCSLRVRLGRGVCAVRVDLTILELAKYEDGVCIRDTLTILGSTEGIATPVCGNMTGYATTFPVKELGEVTLALVSQAEHRFSITVTQLDCGSVPKFISPTYAGVRNEDAKKYVPPPTTTTTKEPPTTRKPDGSSEGSSEESTVPPPRDAEDITEATATEGDKDATNVEGHDSQEQTTLKTGKFPSRTTTPTPGVIISAPGYSEEEDDEGVFLETIDVTPAISGFRRAFELKVQDKCYLFEEEEPVERGFRVIGGFRANLHEYPWQVALVYKKKFFCGGSLISDRHVLTAAHCVFGSFSKGIDQLRVSLGDHDLSTRNETYNVVVGVRRIFWHLHYSPHININDIAIFELKEPVTFNYSVSAVKLPFDTDDQFGGENATVTGWGRYSIKTKKTSPILKEYTAPLVKGETCAQAWKKFPTISSYADKHICLDVKMGTPCHGDSGGPMVTCTGNSCTQVGLVSFGFPLCTNVGLPAVFTRLTYYRPWLDRNLAPTFAMNV